MVYSNDTIYSHKYVKIVPIYQHIVKSFEIFLIDYYNHFISTVSTITFREGLYGNV